MESIIINIDSKDKEKIPNMIKAIDIIMRDYFPECSYRRGFIESQERAARIEE